MSLWNFIVNTLLLYIPLLNLTDGQKDGQRPNTLDARGLEELFFQLWFCVSFWFWREIDFWLYILMYLEYKYSVGVVLVFWFWWEIILGVTSLPILPYQLCHCVSFLVAAGNSFWLLSF